MNFYKVQIYKILFSEKNISKKTGSVPQAVFQQSLPNIFLMDIYDKPIVWIGKIPASVSARREANAFVSPDFRGNLLFPNSYALSQCDPSKFFHLLAAVTLLLL